MLVPPTTMVQHQRNTGCVCWESHVELEELSNDNGQRKAWNETNYYKLQHKQY